MVNTATDKSFVEQRHGEYALNEAEWHMCLKAYQGGLPWARDALIKYEDEDRDRFAERQARTYSRNFTRRIVNNRQSFLFRKKPTIEAKMIPTSVLSNIDRRGNSVAKVMEKVAKRSMVAGMVYIIVDTPYSSERPRNESEAQKMNIRPYWSVMSPLSAVNWRESDEDGSLDWILFYQSAKAEILDFENGTPKLKDVSTPPYLYYDRQEWVYFTSEGKIALDASGAQMRGPHGLAKFNKVPVVPVRFDTSLDENGNECFVGRSLITDIVSINREIINLSSSLAQILNKQGFSLLAGDIEGEPTLGADGKPGVREVKLGPSEILRVPPDGQMPAFIGPDAGNIDKWLAVINTLVDECYLQAELQKGSATETGQAESGISRAFKFLNTNQSLKEQYSRLVDDIIKALVMTAQVSGQDAKPEDIKITGPEDFGIQGPNEALLQFKTLMEALASPAMNGAAVPDLVQENILRIVDVIFSEIGDPRREALKKKIEDHMTGDRAAIVDPELLKPVKDKEPPEVA